jgi:AdoMet-dependent heme synthase
MRLHSASRIERMVRVALQNLWGYGSSVPRPYFMVVEPTLRCNARCTYCDSWETPASEEARELTTDEHLRLLREAHALGVRMVSYTGGEPFLRADLVDMASAARSLGMRVLVNTNGYLVNGSNVAKLVSTFDAITVSIDSLDRNVMTERRGQAKSLDLALRALDLLVPSRRNRDQVRVNVVLDERNAGDLDTLASELRARGVPMLLQPLHRETLFPTFVPVESLKKTGARVAAALDLERFAGPKGGLSRGEGLYLKPFYKGIAAHLGGSPPWFRCYAGAFSFQVSAYGDVMLCQTLRRSLGNIRDTSLEQIWRSMTETRRHISSDDRKCSCWLLCTTLNYLHADRADRVFRRLGIAKVLGWLGGGKRSPEMQG